MLLADPAAPESPAFFSSARVWLGRRRPRGRLFQDRQGVAMACSPGSGASLEGISLGSSEEAELCREGRKRWGGEARGGVLSL